MTPTEFELIRQSGLEKWSKPEKIKTIKEAREWWDKKGSTPCSFCRNFKTEDEIWSRVVLCTPCSLINGEYGCMPTFNYLSNMFVWEEPKPTIARFHKKSAIIKQKIQKTRYLKRFEDIEFKGA
ncbi:hypothetical protein LCGC14_3021830 [marine sediment metagenome]|uniref:Uncharacterized protein n=1 Tax=marine sediment metagenome TaxID=412755 RepID=A0A0F8WV15_9ZZZZ